MNDSIPADLAIVGLGLIGGSLAKAARAVRPDVRIVAVEPNAEVRELAVRSGVADLAVAAPGPDLARCSLAVLCTPIAAIESLLGPVSAALPDLAVLSDVGGAKERVVEAAKSSVRNGVRFVGAHPMFGGQGGYGASAADKWRGGTVAVCTDGEPGAVRIVTAFHEALGARIELCTAREHDEAVAMISHLPYLLASALAESAREAGPLAVRLAGPGLRDMTRLAEFPFDIQGEVARRNVHLPRAAKRLEEHLTALLEAIRHSPEAAREALQAAHAARKELF